MRTMMQRRDRIDAGFTLLEMIVVLVIVGLAASIVGARTGNVTPQVQVRTSAQKLSAELRLARAEALRTGRTQSVIIDPVSRTYRFGQGSRPAPLPAGLSVRVAASGLESEKAGAREIEGPLQVTFGPDGSSSGGMIVLSAGGANARIVVDWLTGATRIAWGQ